MCTQPDDSMLNEGFRSFPSGHSSSTSHFPPSPSPSHSSTQTPNPLLRSPRTTALRKRTRPHLVLVLCPICGLFAEFADRVLFAKLQCPLPVLASWLFTLPVNCTCSTNEDMRVKLGCRSSPSLVRLWSRSRGVWITDVRHTFPFFFFLFSPNSRKMPRNTRFRYLALIHASLH